MTGARNKNAGKIGRQQQKDIPGLTARSLAVDAVMQVLKSGAALDDVLDTLLAGSGIEARDVALVRAIATVCFRRYGSLHHVIEERLEKEASFPARLSAILLTGAAQILHMDVPDRSAVDLAVHLASGDRTLRGFSGLVNAVLRRIAREREEIERLDDPLLDIAPWLRERWLKVYGPENLKAIAIAHRNGPSVDISVKGDSQHWMQQLNADCLVTGSLRLRDRTPVRELPGYTDGVWWVQDAAAALPVKILAPEAGETIADLCAAPGGKTAQIAVSGARVIAVDRSAARLKRLQENMQRLALEAEVRAADALTLQDGPYDAVLLDAPCSATGTLRRHPEIAWIKGESDIAKLVDLQKRLLEKAATLLVDGGRLVYCTCSLEPEEGEEQINAFLAVHPDFHRDPVRPGEIGLEQAISAEGDIRTLPPMAVGPDLYGLDGFFCARLRKSGK